MHCNKISNDNYSLQRLNISLIKLTFLRDSLRQWWHESRDFLEIVWKSQLPKIVFILAVICLLSGMIILALETNNAGFTNIIDSTYWSIVTLTTTGYGDKVPLTPLGRLFAGFVMLAGIAAASFFTATISSIFVAKKLSEERGLQKIYYRGHLLILGWNESGVDLVNTLLKYEDARGRLKIVLINNLSPEDTEELQQQFNSDSIKFLKGDYTGVAVLNRAKTGEAGSVLILSEQNLSPELADEKTVLATLAVKSVNPRAKVFVHLRLRSSESHLRRAGADRVIISDKYTGFLLANCAAAPNMPKVIDGILGPAARSMLKSIPVPDEYVGKSFISLSQHLKSTRNQLLIGFIAGESILSVDDILSDDISSVDDFIKRKFMEAGRSTEDLETTSVNLNPSLDYIIRSNDMAVVLGGN